VASIKFLAQTSTHDDELRPRTQPNNSRTEASGWHSLPLVNLDPNCCACRMTHVPPGAWAQPLHEPPQRLLGESDLQATVGVEVGVYPDALSPLRCGPPSCPGGSSCACLWSCLAAGQTNRVRART